MNKIIKKIKTLRYSKLCMLVSDMEYMRNTYPDFESRERFFPAANTNLFIAICRKPNKSYRLYYKVAKDRLAYFNKTRRESIIKDLIN